VAPTTAATSLSGKPPSRVIQQPALFVLILIIPQILILKILIPKVIRILIRIGKILVLVRIDQIFIRVDIVLIACEVTIFVFVELLFLEFVEAHVVGIAFGGAHFPSIHS
jgi:hypothetical protein